MEKTDRHHLDLLCDIGELASMLTGSDNMGNFLQRTVVMVAHNLKADVCSIYLYDDKSEELVLQATIGLNPKAVGKIRMKPGEGLVGTALDMLQPILEGSGSQNPKFKYFKEADEDRFESFIAVPIQRGVEKIGVIVVQHAAKNYFDTIDVMALRAIASQLAGAIENVKLLMSLERKNEKKHKNTIFERLKFIKGKSACGGYAYAPASIYGRSHSGALSENVQLDDACTLGDFYEALKKTIDQLEDLQTRVSKRLPESASLIFTAHFMILKDESFINRIVDLISKGTSACEAVKSIARHYVSIFSSSSHAYMREKVVDIEDLAYRILNNISHGKERQAILMKERIVIARELYPSDVLTLAAEDIKGIILVSGGVTSHVSILVRSMQIPLVIADNPEFLNLPEETPVLMDADIGNIYVRPSKRVIRQFDKRNETRKSARTLAKPMASTTETKDGVRVRLLSNINLLSELALARELKAEGIGLYRTEFPFLIRSHFPSEEEQYVIYRRVFAEMAGKTVTVRTLDISGDKVLPYSDATGESNPELGLRSIRFLLRHRDIFEEQLRAILRAASNAPSVRIMFPFISSLDEFRQTRQIVYDCVNQLAQGKVSHHNNPELGFLVELPSIRDIIDELAIEADFVSIGTNDFVQYMLAADRTNEKVSDYYQPYHPAVLRSLAMIVKSIVTANTDVSVCGEMASDPRFIPFFLGIGVRTLSVGPRFLPDVQGFIAALSLEDAQSYARQLLGETSLSRIHDITTRIKEHVSV